MVWLLAAAPQQGSVAPDFTARDVHGNLLKLSEMVKTGTVVLAFFPKAFTLGCTREMKAYQARIEELKAAHAKVVAVSTDSPEALRRFQHALNASFHFVSDTDGSLTRLYDTKFPFFNIASRRTFVIGKGRTVLKVEEGADAIDPAEAVSATALYRR